MWFKPNIHTAEDFDLTIVSGRRLRSSSAATNAAEEKNEKK
jgi:hypothetical protein